MPAHSNARRAPALAACLLLGPITTGLVPGSMLGCDSTATGISSAEEPARTARNSDEPLSEVGKIRALIQAVRESDLQFVQDGETCDAKTAADELDHRLARTPGGVVTATQFIDRIGAGKARSKTPDLVRLSDGTMLPVSDWMLKRLTEMEGVEYVARRDPNEASADSSADVKPAENSARDSSGSRTREVGILDALTIVERSDLVFVAPPRKTPKGKVKGKRKEYTGPEFSEMLRKKWELLGKDISDLDAFIEEIASDAFVSMTPYLVTYRDGREEQFRGWLEDQLEMRRKALAKGGAP